MVLMALRIVEVTVIYYPCLRQKQSPGGGTSMPFPSSDWPSACWLAVSGFGSAHARVDVCSELRSGGNLHFLSLIFSLSSCCILCIV